jgi:hypothetical protein
LEKNGIVVAEGEKYGKVYFVSDSMDFHWEKLEAILKKSGDRGRGGENGNGPI